MPKLVIPQWEILSGTNDYFICANGQVDSRGLYAETLRIVVKPVLLPGVPDHTTACAVWSRLTNSSGSCNERYRSSRPRTDRGRRSLA